MEHLSNRCFEGRDGGGWGLAFSMNGLLGDCLGHSQAGAALPDLL